MYVYKNWLLTTITNDNTYLYFNMQSNNVMGKIHKSWVGVKNCQFVKAGKILSKSPKETFLQKRVFLKYS